MKSIKGLDVLGISPRDGRVYVALLENGMSSIRKLSDITGINRGSVYESIKALQEIGLASFQQSNINKKYFAEDPSKILTIIDDRKARLDEIRAETKQLLPQLQQKSAYLPYANIKFYEDHEGVTVILRDLLDTVQALDDKHYCAISSKEMRKYLYKNFPNFTKQRVRLGINVDVIAIGDGGSADPLANRKWLKPAGESEHASYNLIYGNKFAMIALNNTYDPYGIIIEDAGVANAQRLLFDQLWTSL